MFICFIFTELTKQDSKIRMYSCTDTGNKTINWYKSHTKCALLFCFDLVLQPKKYNEDRFTFFIMFKAFASSQIWIMTIQRDTDVLKNTVLIC